MANNNHYCHNCNCDLNIESSDFTYWEFEPCSHTICVDCFTQFAIDFRKVCLSCHQNVCAIKRIFFKVHEGGQNETIKKQSKTSLLLHKESNDFLTLHTKDYDHPINVCIMPDQDEDPETRKAMSLIFSKLKGMLNPTRTQTHTNSHDINDIPGTSYFDKLFSIVQADSSLLLLCLAHLAIGKSTIPKLKQKAAQTQLFLAAENL